MPWRNTSASRGGPRPAGNGSLHPHPGPGALNRIDGDDALPVHIAGSLRLSRKEILRLVRRATEVFLVRLLEVARHADPGDPPLRRLLVNLLADTGDLVRFIEHAEEAVPPLPPPCLRDRGSEGIPRQLIASQGAPSGSPLMVRDHALRRVKSRVRELSRFFALLSDHVTHEHLVHFLRDLARSVDSEFESAASEIPQADGMA